MVWSGTSVVLREESMLVEQTSCYSHNLSIPLKPPCDKTTTYTTPEEQRKSVCMQVFRWEFEGRLLLLFCANCVWSDFYFTVSTCGWLSGEDYRSKCEQEKNCTAVLFEILLLFCVDIILIAVDYPLRWHIITDNAPVKTTGDAGFLACSKTAERAFSKTEGLLFLLKPIHVFSLYLWL